MLNRGTFKEEDLIKVFGPPSLHAVDPGHFVQLNSGGPKMIVIDSTGPAPEGKARVAWSDEDGNMVTDEFPVVCLTAWPAADYHYGRTLEEPKKAKCDHDYQLNFSAVTWRRFVCTKCKDSFTQDRD